ncbi:MAG: tyrosine-type recombinase/integrase [Azoarcus sp.]|jgi:integrase|nr:tyrosine-type recombinase/integrase [Azoarcus sp.]
MATNKLKNEQVERARAKEKQYRLTDGDGMFLLVDTRGGRYWRMDYSYAGKRKTLALGPFPDVSLAKAREARTKAREALREGIDPGEQRKIEKITRKYRDVVSFEAVAREWHRELSPAWTASTAHRNIRVLERSAFPWIGGRKLDELTAPELLACIRRVRDQGHMDTAHRLRELAGQVFRYGIQTGRCERNVAGDLRGAIPPKGKKNVPAITQPKEFGKLLRAIWAYSGLFPTRCAFKLSALFGLRPGEIRQLEWAEIDFDERLIRIPMGKMKARRVHVVPLASQALDILLELQPLTGRGKYCFPGMRDHAKPMSENTIGQALRRMGYNTTTEHTAHGFRSSFSTISHGSGLWRPEVVEVQLAHKHGDAVRLAYDRGDFLLERRRLMDWWADECDRMRVGADVIALPTAA